MALLRVFKNGEEIKSYEIASGDEVICGRGENCQIRLEDEAISRAHFKIWFEDGKWKIEKLSKFGALLRGEAEIQNQELDDFDAFSIPPYHFQFENELLSEEEQNPIAEQVEMAAANIELEKANDDLTQDVSEKTNAVDSRIHPYISLVKDGQVQETFRLEGVSWTAGRDENCEIQVLDRRSSRKHFKIYKNNGDYYVQDLKSSNGTLHNEKTLGPQAVKLESGDSIVVGDTMLVFEIKDPVLEQELQNLPAPTTQEAQPQNVVYLPVNIDVSGQIQQGPGAVRMDLTLPTQKKNSPMRFALIVVLVLAVGIGLYMEQEQERGSQQQASKAVSKDPYDNLTPQEQTYIKQTYTLAKNLFMETKYELALLEIRKIHERIPQYQDSKKIEGLAEAALDAVRNKQIQEEFERKQKEAIAQAKNIIEKCDRQFRKSMDIPAIEACLSPAMEIDPENITAKKILERARDLIEQKELEKSNRAEYARRVQRREAIYAKAKQLEKNGKLVDAIDTYQRHIASLLPDPKNLEEDSKSSIDKLKSDIKQTLSQVVQEAEAHLANAEYRDAIIKLEKGLELEPNNPQARDIYNVASKELFKRMKGLFSDSVVEESLGNIESAKAKWRRIIEQDVPRGEYRAKAEIKLRKYGE